MNLPSFKQISDKSIYTLMRFPFALIVALIGSIAAVWLIQVNWETNQLEYAWVYNLALVCALGIAAFLSTTTLAEQLEWDKPKTLIVKTGVLGLLAVYFFLLPENLDDSETEHFIRYLLYFLAVHLFVSFAPFIGNNKIQDFWEYNKMLFLRIISAGVFSAVLFAGLAIAMASLDNLLEINIEDRRYPQLWFLVVGIFNTWFFLAGVPKPDELNTSRREYPGILKIFVQYILIPLVTIYILILYLYTGKILVEWEWPNGWVANLVLGYSIAGIFSLLLLYPIRNDTENRWIQLFSRGYYMALIPLIILLAFSISVRISEYGITVNRYFVVVLALWLVGIVAYFLISSQKNIKIIPASLCLIAIFISFGPHGAFEIAEQSQLNRFEYFLGKNDLLKEGNPYVIPAKDEISFEDRQQISSIMTYLIDLKGVDIMQPYFEKDLDSITKKEDSLDFTSNTEKIMTKVNLEYVSPWIRTGETENQSFNFYSQDNITKIENYDYFIESYVVNKGGNPNLYSMEGAEWKLSFDSDENRVMVENIASTSSISIDIFPLATALYEKYRGSYHPEIPTSEMTLRAENESLKIMFLFQSLNGSIADSLVNNLNASVFIKEK